MSSYNAQALTCILRVRLPVIVLGVPQAFLLQLIQVAPQLGLADPVSAAIANPAGLVGPFNAQGWISQALPVCLRLCAGTALYALRRRGRAL